MAADVDAPDLGEVEVQVLRAHRDHVDISERVPGEGQALKGSQLPRLDRDQVAIEVCDPIRAQPPAQRVTDPSFHVVLGRIAEERREACVC